MHDCLAYCFPADGGSGLAVGNVFGYCCPYTVIVDSGSIEVVRGEYCVACTVIEKECVTEWS